MLKKKPNLWSDAVFYRAEVIRRSLGVRCAAGYLRNQGVSLEAALWLLTRRKK
jgi:hypothetical protein